MEIYELKPLYQKSFYGKAKVIVKGETKYLRSYDTIVMSRDGNGKLHRYWNGWSATTGKHIRAFCGIGKTEWNKMEVEKL